MFSSSKIKQNFHNIHAKYKWPEWNVVEADQQDHTLYISINQTIELNTDIVNIEELLSFNKVSKGLKNAIKRPSRIPLLSEAKKITFYISLTLGISLLVLPLLADQISNHKIQFIKAYLPAASAAVAFLVISTLCDLGGKKLSLLPLQQPLENYFYDKNKIQAKAIKDILFRIKSGNLKIFFNEADSIIKSIENEYWKSDNWDICLLVPHKFRKAVSYLGEPPGGDALFLKSELRKLGFNVESPHKKITSNSRESHLQEDALSTKSKINRLIKLIEAKHPLDKNGNRHGLNKGKKSRLEAIKYVYKNHRYWTKVRENIRAIDDKKYAHHKANIIEFFNSTSRNKDTRASAEPGEALFEAFMKLKDRTLERWLNKLEWDAEPSK